MADNSYTADGGAYSKYGGLTPGGWMHGLANILLPAYAAAFPNARAANLFNGMNQAYNVYAYNKQAHRDKAATEQAVGKKYADMGLDLHTGVDKNGNPIYTLDPSIYKQVAPDYGNAQGIEGLRRGGEGKDPQFGYMAPMDKVQQWYQDNVMKPNLDNNQNIATLNQINQSNPYDTGASQNPTEALNKFVHQPPTTPGLGAMQPSAGPTLQAGAVTQGPPPPPPMSPMDRFLSQNYVGNPATVVSGAGQKATETNQKGTLAETIRHNTLTTTETGRHNRADEGIGRTNAKAHMISAQKPSGSGSQNPYTIPNAAQNYTQGQIDSIDKTLKTMGYVGKDGEIKSIPQNSPPGWFGMGGHQQTQQEQQAQQLINLRSQLQSQLLPGGGAPFKNQSTTKLKASGKNLGAQYGVHY